ncbi:MBL fold metallo-hydrolase [Staphylococcus sp. IVB6227]|uniref:MBL fold metallo-hydrolase n=1 Tax=Staphylococcus sp. IVB6227 TaxID=2989768 RepID=UPI0021D0D147|nr:MBL fold metallo-hydrolase [Staphylococcus sp. IVB6227]UXR79115.1 MBL fold metallo-hydrolase [Staphylococcus sp. IVB6227]
MKIGKFEIDVLNGGDVQMDGGAIFGVVPKPLWSKKYPFNDNNQVPLAAHPILIRTEDCRIVIDAGIGKGCLTEKQMRNYGVGQEAAIEKSLAQFDLTVDDIDMVLMTHMHFDHATGLVDDEGRSTFPNARHYIQQDEWHEFVSPNIRSQATYWSSNRGDYEARTILFEKSCTPYPGITMLHTGGHSYGHSVIEIESDGEKAVHMSDIFPTVAHVNPLWVSAYDDFPMQSIRAKECLTKKYILDDYWFLFYHDMKYFAAKFDVDGKTMTETVERPKFNE